ncbi:hypothetical protein S101468_01539 [Acetobacter pasteurianus subsp. pasteurianus]|uniref:Uncharacterized protein n=1 Tax=Acetobacter pasteurianus subsp. pasteurianus TaxID=481145 RepID=A0AAC9SNT5_ACEPA|nr:hypothetical protein S101468_01539 [Acetobacter pasteurianus subsp. pasteurianus]
MKKEANGGKAVTPKSRTTRRSPQKTEAALRHAPETCVALLHCCQPLRHRLFGVVPHRRYVNEPVARCGRPGTCGCYKPAPSFCWHINHCMCWSCCHGASASGDTLIARINTWCGEPLVSRLRFVQDPAAGVRPRPQRRKPQNPGVICTLPEMEEGPLRQALETLGTDILKSQNKKRS